MTIKAEITVKGGKILSANLQAIAKKYPKAVDAALFQEGERLRTIAVPFTPEDKGQMRQTSFVTKPHTGPRGGRRVTVGYGGAAAAYALAQHEGVGAASSPPSWDGLSALDYTTSGTGPKFLTRAMIKLRENHLDQLRRRIIKETAKITLKR